MTYLDEIAALVPEVRQHADHPWRQIGRCVYCGPCGLRLYQGQMPTEHPRYTPPRQITPADKMRARWGMDHWRR